MSSQQITPQIVFQKLIEYIAKEKYTTRHGRITLIKDNLVDVRLYTDLIDSQNTARVFENNVRRCLIKRNYNKTGGIKVPYAVNDDVVVVFFDTEYDTFFNSRSFSGSIPEFSKSYGMITGHIFPMADDDLFQHDSTTMFFNQTIIELKDKIRMLNADSSIKDILLLLSDAIIASNTASKSLQFVPSAFGTPCSLLNPNVFDDSDAKANEAKTKTNSLFD